MQPCDDGGEARGWGSRSRGVPSKGYSHWEVRSEIPAKPTSYGEVAGKEWWETRGAGAHVTPWKQGSPPRSRNTICAVPPMEPGWGRRAWRGRRQQPLNQGWSLNGESDTSVSTW